MTETLSAVVRGAGPGVVLVHGAGGSAVGSWGPLLDPLAESWSVVAPNHPGSGDTPIMEGPLDLDNLADRIVETASRAGLDQFVLVAQSMGCSIAAKVAARHPDRIRALALIAGFAQARPSLRLNLDVWERLLDSDPRVCASFLTSISWPETYLNGLTDGELEAAVNDAVGSQPGVRQHIDWCRSLNVTEDLPHIQAPTVVAATTLDRFVSPDHSDDFLRGIPHAKRIDLNAGHMVVVQCTAELLRLVDSLRD